MPNRPDYVHSVVGGRIGFHSFYISHFSPHLVQHSKQGDKRRMENVLFIFDSAQFVH